MNNDNYNNNTQQYTMHIAEYTPLIIWQQHIQPHKTLLIWKILSTWQPLEFHSALCDLCIGGFGWCTAVHHPFASTLGFKTEPNIDTQVMARLNVSYIFILINIYIYIYTCMYTISCGAFREQLWTGIQGQTRQKSLHQSQKHHRSIVSFLVQDLVLTIPVNVPWQRTWQCSWYIFFWELNGVRAGNSWGLTNKLDL